jgi:YbbR domain-containing protein
MIRLIKSLAANIATLSLSLVLAILIWGVAVQANDPDRQLTLRLDIQVIGRPADSAVVLEPETVEVVIDGPGSILDEVSGDEFTAEVDLADLSGSEGAIPINVRHDLQGVEIAFQVPEQARVSVERIVRREIPVRVEVRGSAARGYELGEPFADPATIPVSGVASRVEALSEARVTVFLDNPQQDVVLTRRPVFYDSQGNIAGVNGLDVGAEEVDVTVPVDQLAGFAAKPIIVDWEGEPAQGYRLLDVSVEPDSVLVTGRPAQLDALSRVRTEPIDITGLKSSQTFPVTLDLPEGIELDEVQPVIVEIEIEPILTSSVIRKTPEIRALQQGLTMTLDVEEVRVFLFGPLDKLDSLVDEDVRVTLDLFGLDVGTYRLEPDVDVFVSDVEIRSLQPPQLTVTITRTMTSTEEITSTITLTNTATMRQFPGAGGSADGVGNLLFALSVPAALLPAAASARRRKKALL